MKLARLMKAVSAAVDRFDAQDMLGHVGLERRRSTLERVLGVAGIFGAGLVVGAGVGLLASPVSPAEVRRKLGDGVRNMKSEITDGVRHAKHEMNERFPHARQIDDIVRNGAIKAT